MRNKFKTNLTLYLTVFILIAAGVWVMKTRNIFFSAPVYKYGDTIKEIRLTSLEGDPIRQKEKSWRFFVLLNGLERNYGFVRYMELLAQRFQSRHLEIVLFNGADKNTLRDYRDLNSFTLPILSVQANKPFVNQLFFNANNKRHVRLIDKSGKLVFSSEFLMENDARQVLEKFLIGRIEYPNQSKIEASVGNRFPILDVIDVKSGNDTIIDEQAGAHVWIVFTSNCVSCALKSNLHTYSHLEGGLGVKMELPVSLLFSQFFNITDLEFRVKALGIVNKAYLSKGELKGLENSYFKINDGRYNVITVITDKDSRIVYAKSFVEFVEDFKGEHFEKSNGILSKK